MAEVDAAFFVDVGDLDPHHVADFAGVFDALDAVVSELGDVDEAVFAGGRICKY